MLASVHRIGRKLSRLRRILKHVSAAWNTPPGRGKLALRQSLIAACRNGSLADIKPWPFDARLALESRR
jgi:hypothetical protein